MQTMISETGAGQQLVMPMGRVAQKVRRRGDSLPEYTRYRDDGCDINPTCLTCPLPRCRYEEPGGLRALLNEHRDRQIVSLRTQGVPVDELAVRFRVSRRTVFRVIGTQPHLVRRRKQRIENMPIPIRPEQMQKEAHCA